MNVFLEVARKQSSQWYQFPRIPLSLTTWKYRINLLPSSLCVRKYICNFVFLDTGCWVLTLSVQGLYSGILPQAIVMESTEVNCIWWSKQYIVYLNFVFIVVLTFVFYYQLSYVIMLSLCIIICVLLLVASHRLKCCENKNSKYEKVKQPSLIGPDSVTQNTEALLQLPYLIA